MERLKHIAQSMPDSPGIYKMLDKEGRIIYVGKARSLRKRLLSYFSSGSKDAKTQRLLANVYNIQFETTPDEESALILEDKLIKEHRPKYNIALRDDKTYPFVRIQKEPDLPKVSIVRRPQLKDKKEQEKTILFGPYPNVKLLRMALKGLRIIYPFKSCNRYRKDCLYEKIGLCLAPCEKEISQKNYQQILTGLIETFSGSYEVIIEKLFQKMQETSERQEFESAAFYRDAAMALNAVLGKGIVEQTGLLAIYELRDILKLKYLPRRIEGFDISNIQGEMAVGSMVSFWDGVPDKKNYRRFRIKTVSKIDDFAMIYEVVKRRCTRISKGEFAKPDLFLIDGGPGQLKYAQKALFETNLDIPIIAIAKKREEVYLPNRRQPLSIPKENAGLRLLQHIRDEAHRFAITYHRYRRKKRILS